MLKADSDVKFTVGGSEFQTFSKKVFPYVAAATHWIQNTCVYIGRQNMN